MEFVLTELSSNDGLIEAICNLTTSSTTKEERQRLVRSMAARHGHRRRPLKRGTVLEIRHYRQNDRDGDAKQRRMQMVHSKPKAIASSRIDPFQSWARDVSPVEDFLVTHYINFVFEHGYTACRKENEMGGLFPHIKTNWIPWTLTNPGLLSGILQASCHNLILLDPDNTVYPRLLLKYKADCIRELRKALSQKDELASDTTIALAFMLSVEEYIDGNVGESCLHNEGIMRMVSLRGFNVPGPSGSLGLLLRRCNALKLNFEPNSVNEN